MFVLYSLLVVAYQAHQFSIQMVLVLFFICTYETTSNQFCMWTNSICQKKRTNGSSHLWSSLLARRIWQQRYNNKLNNYRVCELQQYVAVYVARSSHRIKSNNNNNSNNNDETIEAMNVTINWPYVAVCTAHTLCCRVCVHYVITRTTRLIAINIIKKMSL